MSCVMHREAPLATHLRVRHDEGLLGVVGNHKALDTWRKSVWAKGQRAQLSTARLVCMHNQPGRVGAALLSSASRRRWQAACVSAS